MEGSHLSAILLVLCPTSSLSKICQILSHVVKSNQSEFVLTQNYYCITTFAFYLKVQLLLYLVGLESSDSESSSPETDDSVSRSDGSSDTNTDSYTEEENFGLIEEKPILAKQKGRAVYIYMYIMYMLLTKACHHNQFV